MIQDVQYGPEVASVYDSFITPALPTAETMNRLHPHVTGTRVLEIGVGTGRIALPVAGLATELVGLDNSRAMLDTFRDKGVPENVTLLEADFRRPLPIRGPFEAAYSTLGSLACVSTREELTSAFTHIRETLAPGAPLLFDYYSTSSYRPLVDLGTVTVPAPHRGGTATVTVTLDSQDLLTMSTRLEEPGAEPVEFSERILFIEHADIEFCLVQAGFRVEQVEAAEAGQPYDWYLARRP